RVYVEDGRLAQARRYARRLRDARPEAPEPRVTQAWIEELAGALPRATAILRRTLRDFPQSFATALKLARLLERGGEPRAALDVLESVRALLPDCYGVELARADLLLDLGEPGPAGDAIDALALDHGALADLQKRLARLDVDRGRVDQARRRWAALVRFDRHVAGPPVSLHRLDRRPLPSGGPGEIRLFTRLRNQRHRLPWLLDFYRAQGVDRFLVVDNGSDDGGRDYLLTRPDVHLWLTTDAYAEYGGGVRWLNELLAVHGSGHWCLTVDTDEVLAYPHAERLGLRALTRHLEDRGAEALFAFMLDMYPEGPVAEASCAPDESPFPVCPLFDREGYVTRPNPDFPFRMVAGGLMGRLLYEGRQDATYLHKVPLVRWREDFRYTLSMHHLLPVRLAAETGVLLHFKYLSDLPAKAAVEAERKQYGHGGKRYASLNELFERDAALSLRCELSERFRDTGQLVGRGLMRSSPALDALAVATVAGAPLLPGWPAPIPDDG
ncbi:MAG TPA: glycosyltransferase family 2 protein, partial [Geminicoccaceae bacterium]